MHRFRRWRTVCIIEISTVLLKYLKYPNANHPPDERTITAYRNATDTFEILKLSEETSFSRAADALLAITHRTYERPTTSKILSTTEVASTFRTGITDNVISYHTKWDHILVLWENKSPTVFQHLVDELESIQTYPVKFNLNRTSQEDWQAILAKVCVLRSSTPSLTSTRHSSDLKKPQWAILIDGNQYMAIYIVC